MTDRPDAVDIAITRTFDASPDRVFLAWTRPEDFSVWFGGPEAEVPVQSIHMDVRPGGAWRATMLAGPDRREIPWRGSYLEVTAPGRLVFTLSDQPDGDTDAVTVVLNDADGRTQMEFTQAGGNMPPEAYAQARAGWQGFFDTLADLVAGR